MKSPEIIRELIVSLGYEHVEFKSAKVLYVYTKDKRVDALTNISKKITGARYDKTPTSRSSVGKVTVEGVTVFVKPGSNVLENGVKMRRSMPAGVANEVIVVKTINKLIREAKSPVNIMFKAGNKTFVLLAVTKAQEVGRDTKNRKKADIVLIDWKRVKHPISIKQDNAEMWESADSYFGKEAEKIVSGAINNRKIELEDKGTYYSMSSALAVSAKESEKRDVVFGSDIEGKGAVITKTFKSQSFEYDIDNDTLIIDTSNIITMLRDVKGEKDVMFLIRNDKTRKTIQKYPGVRAIAAYQKRINNKVVKLPRNQ